MNAIVTHDTSRRHLLARILDALFGPACPGPDEHEPLPYPLREEGGFAPLEGEVRIERPDLIGFRQIKPILKEAFARFIQDEVCPINEEMPDMGYAVRNIKIVVEEATEPVLRSLVNPTVTPELRSRLMTEWFKSAPDSDLVDLSQCYGVDLVAPETVVSGHLVKTLAVFDDARVYITLVIDGDYAPLPRASTRAISEPPVALEAITSTENADAQSAADAATFTGPVTFPRDNAEIGLKPSTSIVEPVGSTFKPATDIIVPPSARRLVARLHVLPFGGQERTYDIGPDDFPFEISREPSSLCGAEIAPAAFPQEGAKVSRHRHMVLKSLVDDSFFNVSSEGVAGCFVEGHRRGALFTVHFGEWVTLGGAEGPGTVAVKLERAA